MSRGRAQDAERRIGGGREKGGGGDKNEVYSLSCVGVMEQGQPQVYRFKFQGDRADAAAACVVCVPA